MLNEFYDYCKQFYGENRTTVGIYVSGGQGEQAPKLCDKWISRMEQDAGNRQRALNAYHKAQKNLKPGQTIKAFDCSGLIMYFLQNQKGISDDRTARGIYSTLCNPIQADMLYPGDLVFRADASGKIVHCGIVLTKFDDDGHMFKDDNMYTILESKGREYGVVQTFFRPGSGTWNRYGRLKCLESEIYKAQVCDCAKRILLNIIKDIDTAEGAL